MDVFVLTWKQARMGVWKPLFYIKPDASEWKHRVNVF